MASASSTSHEEPLAAVLRCTGDLALRADPTCPGYGSAAKPLAPGEVRVRIGKVGICGSDVHYWTHGAIGDFVVKAPMILGHETAGTVEAMGPLLGSSSSEPATEMRDGAGQILRLGDRVALEPGFACGSCRDCKIGRYNLCAAMTFHATPPVDGTLRRAVAHPASYCFKLPANMSLEEGALCEPMAVGVHACNRAGIGAGSTVLITGAGPIGLVSLLVAKACGARAVAIADINPQRLEVAKSLGANYTVCVDPKVLGDTTLSAELAKNEELGAIDATIECSGAPSAIRAAIDSTRSGGCVVLVGLGPAEVSLPIVSAAVREVDIRGVFRYANCYAKAVALISSGAVDVKPLITHRFPLEQVVEAFTAAKNMSNGAIKIMLDVE